jgi:hypothetical protein
VSLVQSFGPPSLDADLLFDVVDTLDSSPSLAGLMAALAG